VKNDLNGKAHQSVSGDLIRELYAKPLPSTRTGPLYNAFSYPTKISPEAIAVFIATHTKPGSSVLDTFGGSGTTGVAALLCDKPTAAMELMAKQLGVTPQWGPRKAILYELGSLGSFLSSTLCAPPNPARFAKAVIELCEKAKASIGWMYEAESPDGDPGALRHAIWSDVLVCPICQKETSYWDAALLRRPLRFAKAFKCPGCKKIHQLEAYSRAVETVWDDLLGRDVERKKRVLACIYGVSGKNKWQRPPSVADHELFRRVEKTPFPPHVPICALEWGDLHRAGYHRGISHLHHFYTRRNFAVVSTMWALAQTFPEDVRDALKLLVLSYNSTHSTLMTRVVVKKDEADLVLTGSQSGVLYVSGLPVEKNVIEGVRRKATSFYNAFSLIYGSKSSVEVVNRSSERIALPDSSIDYVFTDPPFGDFIPYAEVNQINELWLDKTTDRAQEIIISDAQGKDVSRYAYMMGQVFSEIARVLKPKGLATVVFHSAKADVWRALSSAYGNAGLHIEATSVLDKIQESFKQVVSEMSVKGDPLLLLSKGTGYAPSALESEQVAVQFLTKALELGPEEREPQRLYSRFVARCLELGMEVRIDAREFYGKAREMLGEAA
jgi:16S rRNA G966 N2-methylase RsmD